MQEGDKRWKRFQRLTTWRIFLEENLESFFKEFRTKIQYFGALLEELQCNFLCLFPMVYGCYLQEMGNRQAYGYHEPTCSQAHGGMSLPFWLMVYLTAVLVGYSSINTSMLCDLLDHAQLINCKFIFTPMVANPYNLTQPFVVGCF